MMNIGLVIRHLYPNADPFSDYLVQDDSDGNGPYLKHWDEAKLGPRPTQAELDAVDVAKIEHNAAIDAQIRAEEAKQTPRMLREAALGDPTRLRAVDDAIKALRAQRR